MTLKNSPDGGARILVAENEAPELHGLGRSLEARGYKVESAANGELALEIMRREKPALVICALSPDASACGLCTRIKADPDLAGVPVLLVISLSDPRDVIRGLDSGADDFVIKPADPAQVLRRVQSLLAGGLAPQEQQSAAGRPQILRLLLATCEAAIERKRELGATRELLQEANQKLRSLTLVPEERAQPRAREPRSATEASSPGAISGAATGRHAQPLSAVRSLRVLLIDDDPSLIESLRSALQDEGHKVTAAGGGQAGVDAFGEAHKAGKPFDIVITDLRMPYVDGRQVVSSIRGISPGTPIILLTGWGQHTGSADEKPLQVDRLLGKPPLIRELRAALSELTGRRATDRLG
jgi:DNA-binding response OmpR family regulator